MADIASDISGDQLKVKKCGQPNKILCTLDIMRKCGDLTDTVIHIHDTIFHAHRAILACSSEYFRAMFTSNLSESINGVVHFNNQIDPHIFSLLLDFSYTAEVTVTDTNAQSLLEAACHLQYNTVIDACCDFLIGNLDPSNCLGMQKISESLSLWNMYKKAQAYALDNFMKVVTHDEYHQLTLLELQQYLSSDELNVDREESTYKAIFSWIESNDPEESLLQLLSCVRLPFTRPDFLLEQLDNPIIKQNPECSNMLRSARTSQLHLRENYLSDSTLVPRHSTKSEVVVVVPTLQLVRDVFYYNTSSDRWGILTRLPSDLDKCGSAVGTLNNCIYISGGIYRRSISSNDLFCYHVDKEKWQTCQNLITPRANHTSIGVNGYLYIIGGHYSNKMLDTVERFNPDENQWEGVKPLPIAVSSPIAVSHEHKIYVIGRSVDQSNLQCYDTINNTWKVIKKVKIIGRKMMPVIVVDGIMYIMNGRENEINGYHGMQIYDLKSDTLLPPMSLFNPCLFAAMAVKGKIYVAGGSRGSSCLQSFDPRTDEWQVVTTSPSTGLIHAHWFTIRKYLGPPFSSK